MNFMDLAKQRCSVRNYQNKKVEEEKLELLLEAANVAPTAANYQSERLIVVQSENGLKKLSKGVDYHNAPMAIIVCGDHNDVFVRPFDKKNMIDIDAAIVADHIVLEAEDIGLSTCWLTYFNPDVIKYEFNIPKNIEPIAIIAVGFAASKKASAQRHKDTRKPISSITVKEYF